MTIDKAIEEERYKAKNVIKVLKNLKDVDKYIERCNKIADWLEELKLLRQQNSELQDVVASLECQLGCVREDAIDVFANNVLTEIKYGVGGNIEDFIKEIAEQLKDGVKNG